MTAGLAKFIPLILGWAGIVFVSARFSGKSRNGALVCALGGFAAGAAVAFTVAARLSGDSLFALFRGVEATLFLVLFLVSLGALYRSRGGARPSLNGRESRLIPFIATALAALLAGAFCALRLPPGDGPVSMPVLLLLGAALVAGLLGRFLERRLLRRAGLTAVSFLLAQAALLFFMASHAPRLDLFAPLTMKVMKFIHDFVHQFFESMLIPDHPFFRPDVWGYIGLLFGNDVGLWGGMVIWFAPAAAIIVALWSERLPSVAHVRQGAQRRKLLAEAVRERRWRLVVPWLSVLLLAGAVYRSQVPMVEYWDPKPIPVTASANREISIPMKADEYDLADGRLHKFILREGKSEVRFFVLMKENGHLAVTLDACSICQPEGYGQAEGAVVCYYCKTLIPLETVGEPGGCNPVPVPFVETGDGVRVSAATLLNTWNDTVQGTKKVPGGER